MGLKEFSFMTNTVILSNLRFYAFHGVLSQEKKVGHHFLLSMKIECDFSQAILRDNVNDTVDYGSVCDIINKEMTIRSKLMEHLAGRILYAVFNNFPTVNAISITIIKENPPVNSDCDGCGINISVTREEFLSFYFS